MLCLWRGTFPVPTNLVFSYNINDVPLPCGCHSSSNTFIFKVSNLYSTLKTIQFDNSNIAKHMSGTKNWFEKFNDYCYFILKVKISIIILMSF